MQATEAHIESEPRPDAHIFEAKSREMSDVLSRCQPSLYRRAYRHLGNVADAEDAVQDALLSAYRHLDRFKGQSQMSTWLTAIVTNCARMQLRKRPRQIPFSLDEEVGQDQEYSLSERLADCGASPEDEFRKSELHQRLMESLQELSPSLRKVFELRDLDGLTATEAAHILGVADGTVKGHLSRARTKLKRLLQKALDPERHSAMASSSLPVLTRK